METLKSNSTNVYGTENIKRDLTKLKSQLESFEAIHKHIDGNLHVENVIEFLAKVCQILEIKPTPQIKSRTKLALNTTDIILNSDNLYLLVSYPNINNIMNDLINNIDELIEIFVNPLIKILIETVMNECRHISSALVYKDRYKLNNDNNINIFNNIVSILNKYNHHDIDMICQLPSAFLFRPNIDDINVYIDYMKMKDLLLEMYDALNISY